MNQENIRRLEEEVTGDTEGKYLTFFTDEQRFGLSISNVESIMALPDVTPMPEYPDYIRGVIDLRGEVVPLIDIRLRIGKAEAEYTERACVIVVRIEDKAIGFLVDGVDEVTDIDPNMISPPPQFSEDMANRFLTGLARLEDRIVLLLEPKRILREEQLSTLGRIMEP